MFLILFRDILCPRQMFPSLRSPRNNMGYNVSSFTRAFSDVPEAVAVVVILNSLINMSSKKAKKSLHNFYCVLSNKK